MTITTNSVASISEIDLTLFVALAGLLLCQHLCTLLLHLIVTLDIGVIIDASLSAEPLADSEDASRFDEILAASPLICLQLTADNIVRLVPFQANILAEFLEKIIQKC